MPCYLYSCPKGHVTERTFVSHRDRTKSTRCDRRGCHRRARYSFGATAQAATVQVIPDIADHWNVTVDMRVRGRRHLKDLQKRHGFSDYEPAKQKSPDWVDRPRRFTDQMQRAAAMGEQRARQREERGESA